MLEIYNEKVQDLLIADPAKKPAGGLKVRESPSEFKQVTMLEGKKMEKFSVINLVDLAGSEKAG